MRVAKRILTAVPAVALLISSHLIAQAPYPTLDWYHRTKTLPYFHPSAFTDRDTDVAYDLSRYKLMALTYLYGLDNDPNWLLKGVSDIELALSPTRFTDVFPFEGIVGLKVHPPLADGLKGWLYRRPGGTTEVPGGIARDEWQSFSIKVGGEALGCWPHAKLKMGITVGTYSFEQEACPSATDPSNTNYPGTVALLSSWAQSSFRRIKIYDLDGPPPGASPRGSDDAFSDLIYDMEANPSQFWQNWKPVRNENLQFPADTGLWMFDPVSRVVSSDATQNCDIPAGEGDEPCYGTYYPFPAGNPDNYGVPASGAANGRYSALVYVGPAYRTLRNYRVTGEVRMEKRNWAGSEIGVAVHWSPRAGWDPPTEAEWAKALTGKRIVAPPFPNNRPPAGSFYGGDPGWGRNTHFANDIFAINTLFATNGVRVQQAGWFLGGSNSAANDPGMVRFWHQQSDYLSYEGGGTQGLLEWAMQVYHAYGLLNPSSLSEAQTHVLALADRVVVEIQNNIVPKFYLGHTRNSPGWIWGGINYQEYGGDESRVYGDNRGPMVYLQMYKLATRFPARWESLTRGNPSPHLPEADELREWYLERFTYNLNKIRGSVFTFPGESYYQWWTQPGFWNEFLSWGSDVQHTAPTMYLLTEGMRLKLLTKEELLHYAETFTDLIWNQKAGYCPGPGTFSPNQCIDTSQDVHGHGSLMGIRFGDTSPNFDYWILLAEADFQVWEIANLVWSQKSTYGDMGRFAIDNALLLYAVRFGKPRDLQLRSATSEYVRFGWKHPSDYPGGTNLKTYSIYRRISDGGPTRRIAEIPTSQLEYEDRDVTPGERYVYTIKGRDQSVAIRNETSASDEMVVKVPDNPEE